MVKITLKIEGMGCGMCEAHVNEAVRNGCDVKSVTSSHKDAETIIISENDIDDDKIKSIISETGYTLVDISREPYVKKKLFSFGKK